MYEMGWISYPFITPYTSFTKSWPTSSGGEELTYLVTLNILSSLRALRTDRPKEPAFGLKWVQITSNTLPLITMQSNLKVKVKYQTYQTWKWKWAFFHLKYSWPLGHCNTCWMMTQSRPCGPWPTFAQLSRRWKRQGRYIPQYLEKENIFRSICSFNRICYVWGV